ncbi:biotin--[acetyl-CoA-carboxylase] ligase [Miniphocaeibacter halophilus]|uniref:Biotin--[acetyl-CoA-carboxylase] ligase n=1 Tax=Miniphocaeibacter halophilus TaxID=2931922 RepID=A0AC61N0X9_9FIRM|nr:biotin--[acetyl-CoA-carboxylase] ligase [Miniphocaeibacter halophilus]QQK08824.1 biotin--[acetyl-CoA-carboxylase] ligase [Miniphocaeibacter halophilus]
MTVKENVLLFLENNKGKFISGNLLANKLDVSRNAIWKAINSLREEGYEIDSVKNKGYCLLEENFILSKQSIGRYLNTYNLDIEVNKTLDSTNDFLKKYAKKNSKEGKIIIAEEQTQGKGRLGKSFYSPANSGIYLSILLKPNLHASQALYITTCAAVAVSKAIDKISGENSQIKWVNDIFLNNKKVCGILTEASFDLEGGSMDYAILGIGLNLTRPSDDFPEDIRDIAGYIFHNDNLPKDYKNKVIAEIINNFFEYYPTIENKEFLKDYKKRSLILNKPIYIFRGAKTEEATALDIDNEFRLKVLKKNGEIEYLSSGEVSIRKK